MKRTKVFTMFVATALLLGIQLTAAASQVCFFPEKGDGFSFYPSEKVINKKMKCSEEEQVFKLLLNPPKGFRTSFPESCELDHISVEGDKITSYLVLSPKTELNDALLEDVFDQYNHTFLDMGFKQVLLYARYKNRKGFSPLGELLPKVKLDKKPFEQDPKIKKMAKARRTNSMATAQPQPTSGLAGKSTFISAGHGWYWTGTGSTWTTQRGNYGNLVEDHHNAEISDYYLVKYLWNAGARVYPVREPDVNTNSVIVDNGGTGYSTTGTWLDSTSESNYWGTNYNAKQVSTTETGTAVFTPNIPSDGYYNVYIWYTSHSNRSDSAKFTVKHAGGSTVWDQNQQEDGIIWKCIGNYYFKAGSNADSGSVVLSNQGTDTSQYVIADAVRFGGGMGDQVRNGSTSGEPRFEECSRYYAMFNKAPSTVYNYSSSGDNSDDVYCRPRFAEYMREYGDDGIYLSHHTDAVNGTATGTSTFAYSSAGWDGTFNGTDRSLYLRNRVHYSVLTSIRDLYDANWTSRGTHTNWYGELNPNNLGYDSDSDNGMPAALIELAFHDDMYDGTNSVNDDEYLKEPEFRRICAKAMYVGILRYFEQRDSIDLKTLPEPPENLCVTTSSSNVTVSWTAPSEILMSDIYGSYSFADLATGYRVYTSSDGWGWDNGTYVSGGTTSSYTFTSLDADTEYYFKVAAVNAGGESFPTEVLGVCFHDDPKILIVNGFDRMDRGMIYVQSHAALGTLHRGFLEKMNTFNYITHYGKALASNSRAFDSASNEAVKAGTVSLGSYDAVFWILGQESTGTDTFDTSESTLVKSFINGGGDFFVSGSEIGWDLDYKTGDTTLMNSYLKADYSADDSNIYSVTPATGGIFDGISTFSFDDGTGSVYKVGYPDVYATIAGSSTALQYANSTSVAAVQYSGTAPGSSSTYKVVHMGFPFETIGSDTTKSTMMGRIINYFGIQAADDPPAAPTGLYATAGDSSVSLNWSDNSETDFASYKVYRSTTSGSGYSQISSGLTLSAYQDAGLTNDTTYYYVIKAVDDGANESGYSTQASATPEDTTPPAAPTGLSASAGDSTVSLNWSDNSESDFASYRVYRSTTSGSGYAQIAYGLTASVYTDNSVTNDTTYYYVIKAYDDSSNASGYSAQASAMPQDSTPPAAPTGLSTNAGNGTVSLDWYNNSESDFGSYRVYRSTTSGSGYAQIAYGLTASAYTDNSVTNDTTYYYVVKAYDNSGNASGYSAQASAMPEDPNQQYLVENFESWTVDTNVMFRDPAFSGTSSGVNSSTDSSLVKSSEACNILDPNVASNGSKSCQVYFQWNTAGIGNVRATTYNMTNKPNPIINLTKGLGMYVLVKQGTIDMTLWIRETGSTGAIGTNGGTSGTIEVSQDVKRLNASPLWQYVYFDIPNASYSNEVNGNGVLEGTKGTLEALIFKAVSGSSDTTIEVFVDDIYQGVQQSPDYVPAAPTGLSAEAGNAEVELDWSNNTESDFASYSVYRSTTSGSGYSLLTSGLTTSAYTDSSASNDTTYYYIVRAVDSNGHVSLDSSEVNATPVQPIVVEDFDSWTTAANVMFRYPAWSGTSNGVNTATDTSLVSTTEAYEGTKSNRIFFEWTTAGQGYVRCTTYNNTNKPNPTLDFSKGLGMYVLVKQGTVDMTVWLRETGTTAAIGADGGISGTIEVCESVVRLTPSTQWQYVYIDIPNSTYSNEVNGNGILEGSKGTLEALIFKAVSGNSSTDIEVYIDHVEQK